MDTTQYQPSTRNPQQDVGGGLQPDSPELQPLTNGSNAGLNPNQLPKTDNLRVNDKNNTSSGTIHVQAQPGDTTIPSGGGTSLWIFSAVSLILAIILLAMAKIAKPADAIDTATNKKDNAKSTVQKDKVIVGAAETKKVKPKKKPRKNKKKKR